MERGQYQSKLLSIWRKLFNLIRSHLAFLSIKKVTLGRPTVHGNNQENITTNEVEQNGLSSKVESPIDASQSVNGVSSQSQIEVEGRPDYGLDNVVPSKISISNSTQASKENGLVVGLARAQGPGLTEAQPLPGLNTIIPVESPLNNMKAGTKEGDNEKQIEQSQLNGRTFSIDKRSEAYIKRTKWNLKEPLDEDLHVSNGSDQKLPPPPPPPSLLRYK